MLDVPRYMRLNLESLTTVVLHVKKTGSLPLVVQEKGSFLSTGAARKSCAFAKCTALFHLKPSRRNCN